MTANDIRTLFAFNAWANERTLRAVDSLSEEKLYVDLKTSFGSIHATLVHLCGAEDIWLQRLNGAERGVFMSVEKFPTIAAVKEQWTKVTAGFAVYLESLKDADLEREFSFLNLKGEPVTQLVGQSLQHLVNHSTYHRGQITTLVRQSGGSPVGTDLIAYYRSMKK